MNKKVKEPRFNKYLENISWEELIEEDQGGVLKENPTEEITICDKTIDSCIFDHIDFDLVKLENVELVDVIFENCNLSNQCFDKKCLYRVVFKNCKMIGSSFVDASLHDIKFDGCLTRYLNFSGAKIAGILIQNSELKEASFLENEIKNMTLDQVKFPQTEFMQTKLKEVDFSSCDITDATFDFYSLKGITVDAFQCQSLVGMLGVRIK